MAALPKVPGPKLAPYVDGESLDIDFIQHLGKGVHAHVWKVLINGKVFALKIFTHWENFNTGKTYRLPEMSRQEELAYFDPFFCECRAYGRLKERNQEHLAMRCHGYIFLDSATQARLLQQDVSHDWEEDWGWRPDCAGRPLRALVKDYFDIDGTHVGPDQPGIVDIRNDIASGLLAGLEEDEESDEKLPLRTGSKPHRLRGALDETKGESYVLYALNFNHKAGRRAVRSLKSIHRLGILIQDVHIENIIGGKFIEFSCAWTAPHPCFAPEAIKRDPGRLGWDRLGLVDALQMDDIVDGWNVYQSASEGYLWDRLVWSAEYNKKMRSGTQGRGRDCVETDPGYGIRPEKYKVKNCSGEKKNNTKAPLTRKATVPSKISHATSEYRRSGAGKG
ncbi:kinetochore Sim4 complex subunit FTA2-domain-containing protein [Xylariomycetidae sp. FL2044]|nr:kinetochore Sim4 complex subunit FTA2-domain-containing protein [Xylariomycetidae sp. FL2044]